MNVFNEAEFNDICKKLNADGMITDVTIRYDTASYFNRLKNVVQWDRRGEVVFCVIRPNGRIIAVTSKDYPKDTYRIPTGGIGYDEDILEAVYREVKEELGIKVSIKSFGGVVRIRFEHDNEHVMFYSYLFILEETGGRLLADASDNEVSEIRELDLEGLAAMVRSLETIRGKWQDWGQFRYVTSNAILKYLKKECI